MTSTIIMHVCDKCPNTYPDEKSAVTCEESHKGKKTGYIIFKSPAEFYEEQANGQKTKHLKGQS